MAQNKREKRAAHNRRYEKAIYYQLDHYVRAGRRAEKMIDNLKRPDWMYTDKNVVL